MGRQPLAESREKPATGCMQFESQICTEMLYGKLGEFLEHQNMVCLKNP